MLLGAIYYAFILFPSTNETTNTVDERADTADPVGLGRDEASSKALHLSYSMPTPTMFLIPT